MQRIPGVTNDHAERIAERYHGKYPESDLDSLEITLRVLFAQRTVMEAFGRCLTASGFWGSQSRYAVLRNLYLSSGQTLLQNELSRQMNVTPGNVTRLIDSLEGEGLVTRTTNPSDRRFTHIQLTPAGEELCAKLVPNVIRFSEMMSEDFTPAERTTLRDLLRRFERKVETLYPEE